MSGHCPKCGSEVRTKAGFIGEAQRWLCKGCGCKYTRSTPRGMPMQVKRRALQLYLEGLGFRAIGRLLGQRLSNEMFAFGKHAGVDGENIFQVVGSASAHMNAEDAS